MPYIEITLAAGRTTKQKQDLMAAVADAVAATIDVHRPAIRVWINEIPVAEMSIAGVPLDEIRRMRAEGTTDL
jgi:4-oxalocrotonate tautomerase